MPGSEIKLSIKSKEIMHFIAEEIHAERKRGHFWNFRKLGAFFI